MRWIDTHVHLFSNNGGDNSEAPLVYSRQELNTPDVYFDILGENKPEGVVVVDFSKSKDSAHVINSLDELKAKGVKAAGVIKANFDDERTLQWMQRDDVKGIRLYAKDSTPDLSGAKWIETFAKVKANRQHILVFGSGKYLLGLIEQIPEDITILVDHLGLPDVFGKGEDADFEELLVLAKARGNIYFKGPGYRTSMDVEKVKPVVKKIVANVGIGHLILGASDGPFAGPVLDPSPEYEGKKFGEVMDYEKVIKFTEELASAASNDDAGRQKILCDNAKELYEF